MYLQGCCEIIKIQNPEHEIYRHIVKLLRQYMLIREALSWNGPAFADFWFWGEVKQELSLSKPMAPCPRHNGGQRTSDLGAWGLAPAHCLGSSPWEGREFSQGCLPRVWNGPPFRKGHDLSIGDRVPDRALN